MAFCQHRMHWLCCKTKRSQWPAYGARALCSVFSLRGLEQRVDRDRSSGRAVRFASSNLKQLTCIQAFYLVSILTQSTCKKWGIWYIFVYIYIYIYMSDMLPDMFIDAEMERVREEKRREKKRKEEKKKEDQKRESLRRKKVQVREKVGKSQNAVFFQWFVAPEGRKAGSLKRRVRGHVVRWEMKSCTPLWRKAHFQFKMYKAHQLRNFFEVGMSKKCIPLWHEAHFQVQMYKTQQPRSLLEVEMFKKCTPLWREATCRSQKCRK